MRNSIKKRELLYGCFVLVSLSLICQIQSQPVSACDLIDRARDTLFITYEQTTKVKTDNGKIQEGVLLRLHNNSTCVVLITTGTADKFLKPLPGNHTVLQRIKREIEYDLPDGVLVPDIQYRYSTSRGSRLSVGGDNFYGLRLLDKRSLLFEVPLKHFDRSSGSNITITFQYAWEQERRATHNYPSVEHTVRFWTGELPEVIKGKIQR